LYFNYGKKETAYLKERDKLLGAAIERIGPIQRKVDHNLFTSVVRHIIGQQISTRAQETVWRRLVEKVGAINTETICELELNKLQTVGMTFKKAGYIKEFAEKVRCGDFDLQGLHNLSDTMIINKLTTLKGIGRWTAEMVMIFGMQRPDIVSFGDLAILRGMRILYRQENIDSGLFTKYTGRYSPHGTVASLYLWAIAGGT
jgi:DNA-3-methyladenine glycosylase II